MNERERERERERDSESLITGVPTWRIGGAVGNLNNRLIF